MSNVSRWYRPCCTIRRPPSGSVLGRGTHSPGLNLVPDSARTTAYVLYAIVFQETSVRHTRARTLFVLLPRSRCLLSAVTSPVRASCLFLFRELHRSHFAPGSCFSSRWQLLAALRASSRRYRLPFLPLPSTLSCPDLPLFIRSMSLQGRKRIVEAPRVDRLTIAWLFFDPTTRKINVRAKILG